MRIISESENQPKSQADPYMIAARGRFYIYTTGGKGVHCYVSDRIDGKWKYIGVVLRCEGEKDFWAPCVLEDGGRFYMYYSSVPDASSDSHDECIKAAVSENPEGPFRYEKTLLAPFSIDPHVVKSGGKLYMFYSTNDYEAKRAGTYIAVSAMSSPLSMEGKAVAVLRPTLDEEIFQRDRFRKGQHWHTLEGAFYFRDGDTHYLIYSGNCWQNEFYYLGYATANTAENDLTKVKFTKYPSESVYAPLIAANDFESGTGHNSVIKIDGTYYCVYHGRDAGEKKPYDDRSARACKLIVKNGVLLADRKKSEL